MKRINDYFCFIEKDEIIMICKYPNKDKQDFIIYKNTDDKNYPIHINTEFRFYGNNVEIAYSHHEMDYDRSLCRTIDDLQNMTLRDIESQAYGAYMDGAR